MKFFFILAVVVSTCMANQAKPYDAFIKCDKGKRFAVVLPTGPKGTMDVKKLEHEYPQHFTIQRTDIRKFKGYVCMHIYHLLFYTEIELFTVARIEGFKNVENFTWVAEVSQVSVSNGETNEVLKTYHWNLDDFIDFSELSNVNILKLHEVLR